MTLPKTYDDMVLEYPKLAWVFWLSMLISGIELLAITMLYPWPGPIALTAQIISLTTLAFVLFSFLTRIAEIGDALGFIGAFEKKG